MRHLRLPAIECVVAPGIVGGAAARVGVPSAEPAVCLPPFQGLVHVVSGCRGCCTRDHGAATCQNTGDTLKKLWLPLHGQGGCFPLPSQQHLYIEPNAAVAQP